MALKGIRVIEMAGLAPAPFCGKILHDFGASVLRVDRILHPEMDCLGRGKRSISLNLKHQHAVKIVRELCQQSDVLIEPFRPGVMERLSLGPDVLMGDNERLIYARITGYGQTGPKAGWAGHDINYLATSGVLWMLKKPGEAPVPPINLLADFAGGGLTCAMGIMAALFERTRSGKGQVVDCSMTDGAAYVSSWLFRSRDLVPIWGKEPGRNLLDGGSYYYGCYETSDGNYMAVGALEPAFFARFLHLLGVENSESMNQFSTEEENDSCRVQVAAAFKQRTRAEWSRVFSGEDACVVPVLSPDEAASSGDLKAIDSQTREEHRRFVPMESDCGSGTRYEPIPAPTLSRTPGQIQSCEVSPRRGQHSGEVLTELGYNDSQVQQLVSEGAVELASESKL